MRALRESGVVVPVALATAITGLTSGLDIKTTPTDSSLMSSRTVAINTSAMAAAIPVHFSAVDLEYSMLENLTDARAIQFARKHNITATSCHDLMAKMGSKGTAAAPSDKAGAKAPYLRAELADWLAWDEIAANVKDLLWRWARGATDEGQYLPRPSCLT